MQNYTQNIDGLELDAGLPTNKIVQAHGHMRTAHCIDCHDEFPMSEFMACLEAGTILYCPKCKQLPGESKASEDAKPEHKGLVKPDIVFFGESLPVEFHFKAMMMFAADLVIVMGTSLKVFPFASLVDLLGEGVPIVLINRENPGLHRDKMLFLPGEIEETIAAIAADCGWGDLNDQLRPVTEPTK